jgi:hypothetical protein
MIRQLAGADWQGAEQGEVGCAAQDDRAGLDELGNVVGLWLGPPEDGCERIKMCGCARGVRAERGREGLRETEREGEGDGERGKKVERV